MFTLQKKVKLDEKSTLYKSNAVKFNKIELATFEARRLQQAPNQY
jgi:hypothetical protein